MKTRYLKFIIGLFLVFAVQKYANADELTGRVLDAKGKPVSGALIYLVQYPDVKATTDRNGEYTITATENSEAVINSADIFSKSVILSDSLVVVMGLETSPVNRGYDLINATKNTAASARTVFAEDLEKNDSKVNASNALFGELLGLSVLQESGTVAENQARLNYRGLGRPLVLVDGFERDLDGLTVEEIESVTLLKDAASQAIYGMRGANGVLLVNTKKGKYNTMEIDLKYDHGVKFAKSTIPMVDAFTYASAMNEALANDGLAPEFNQYQLNAYRDGGQPGIYSNVNWANEIFKDVAHSNSYNVQVRGGNGITRFYGAVAYDTDESFIKLNAPDPSIPNQFKYSNLNVRTNVDVNISKNTLLTINMLGKLQENSRGMLSESDLMKSIYNTSAGAFPIKTENGNWGASTTWKTNPVAELSTAGFTRFHTRTLYANINIKQNLDAITKGLNASARFGMDSYSVIREKKYRTYQTETITPVFDNDGNPTDLEYNLIGERMTNFQEWNAGTIDQWRKLTGQGQLDYKRTFNKSTVGGGYIFEISSYSGYGQHKMFNRVNNVMYASYGYDHKYLLDATFSVGSSNVLNPRRKWGYFPAISAGWVVSQEDFAKNSEAIDYLKVNASWGITGSDNMDFDLYKVYYQTGKSYLFGNFQGVGTIEPGSLPVVNLTYPKTRSVNVGAEGTFFGGMNVSVDVFDIKEYDQLIESKNIVSSVIGIDPGMTNSAEYAYKGVELGLGYTGAKGDLKYSAMGHFTFTRSEIINNNEQVWKNDFNRATGHPVGQIFGYESIGFFKDQADIDNSPVQTFSEVQPGDIKYKDQDDNGIIDQYDRIAIGNNSIVPEMYFSLDLNVEYRKLGINLLFQGTANHSAIMKADGIYRPLVDNNNISQHYYDNRWTETNQDALYPRLTNALNENNNVASTIWLQDLSYLKLRTAEIYYTLPKQWVERVKLGNATIFARGYNLFSIDKMRVGDAEAFGLNFPMYSSVNLGVKINF
ncbi:SusC/RagA family TonB-linked outer membrane protein [Maribellus sp. CM-23]|uniref:SusC/RagA family TonB-linked outer membrane protein n=1 Tax=Maribellus sp. CM-23 TaxID=2781026 RepID=UPI001F22661A|nr:SusC/RagA family TonB-linked outer membrane protein [Maribellus sp. CM-23]MCE4563977.1 SusC/RagA family TonB-linked outer membrane protein [Maribellus sp. CM-23]